MPITQEQVDAEKNLIEECQFIADKVALQTEVLYGWKPGNVLWSYSVDRSGRRKFFDLTVPPDYGIFGSIIKQARLSCYFEKIPHTEDANCYWIVVSLSYEHPGGGRNGHTMFTMWLDERGNSVINIRKEGER